MAISSFDELCAGFCELAKVPAPRLVADDRGLVAFHVTLRGSVIDLAYRPTVCPDHFFVLFNFGPHGEQNLARLKGLLEANFVLLQANAPVFSRNPATGDIVLQHACPLFEATPSDLWGLITREIERSARWHQDACVRNEDDDGPIVDGGTRLDRFGQFA